MKIRIAIVILTCIALVACWGAKRKKHKTGWEEKGLKGKVKTVHAKQYSDTCRVDTICLISEYGYVFDSVGNETKEYSHGVKGDNFRTVKTYNSKGQCILTSEYIIQGIDTSERMNTIHVYDNNGNQIEDHYDSGTVGPKTKYTYDSVGELKAYYRNNPDDTVFRKGGGFKYDDKGNVAEYDYYYPSGLLQGKRLDIYSNDGKIVKSDMYWDNNSTTSSGSIKHTGSGLYDGYENLVLWTEYKPDGSVKEKAVNKITYDKKGNMIKQVVLKNDKPSEHTEFEIVYY